MTISHDLFLVAQGLRLKARKMSGYKNPFISLLDLELSCKGNEDLEYHLREMVNYSLRYAETVCRFEQIVMGGQEANEDQTRLEIEVVRSTIHDATIASINILSRSLKKAGRDNTWIKKLVAGQRAAYGKLAILIAFETVMSMEGVL